ncbi:DUF4249 domain-containing protein [Lewinella sp. IMCC34191]|uniref:DUF4249 domain-containing protein n=1 Tax=Lewinella sp. IMCC34191 TaxID=2259172 RepID=UPI000E266373|nr:DUF4249 domain-containing protein [Lewinella sp. IMCC34191]
MKYAWCLLLTCLLLQHCVDPIEPVYDYTTGFILVEGGIVAGGAGNEIRIRRSDLSFGRYVLEPIRDALVFSIDGSGAEVAWLKSAQTGVYLPPNDFAASEGETYHVRIQLAGGEIIESDPERIPQAVPFSNLSLSFNQEAYFSDSRQRFVPAFSLLVDIVDPADTDNFYLYTHRTWSQLSICATCHKSVYRNGVCVETASSRLVDHYDYSCLNPCWAFTDGDAFQLLSDELNPGGQYTAVPAARIDFAGVGRILAEVRQYAITRKAFAYFSVLKDLTEGSAGLNAPLPAPLYGNLRDVSDRQTTVLGYVSARSVSTDRLAWNRDSTDGTPISIPQPPVYEPLLPSPPSAPCDGPNRTASEPDGWND